MFIGRVSMLASAYSSQNPKLILNEVAKVVLLGPT
jgi:hypothetical protein